MQTQPTIFTIQDVINILKAEFGDLINIVADEKNETIRVFESDNGAIISVFGSRQNDEIISYAVCADKTEFGSPKLNEDFISHCHDSVYEYFFDGVNQNHSEENLLRSVTLINAL